MKLKDGEVKMTGVVLDCYPQLKFKIEREDGKVVTGYMSGKMKQNKIKVLVGDRVEMVVPPQGDLCRIEYRR